MNARPALLADLVGTSLHRVPRNAADHREEARRVLSSAREFRRTAQLSRDADLRLPVISGLHEAARLAVTAVDAVLVRAQMAIAPIPPPPAGREFPGELG